MFSIMHVKLLLDTGDICINKIRQTHLLISLYFFIMLLYYSGIQLNASIYLGFLKVIYFIMKYSHICVVTNALYLSSFWKLRVLIQTFWIKRREPQRRHGKYCHGWWGWWFSGFALRLASGGRSDPMARINQVPTRSMSWGVKPGTPWYPL